ncbi:MAG: ABC transporter ATP-binding protein [Phycisphaerales bacterium]
MSSPATHVAPSRSAPPGGASGALLEAINIRKTYRLGRVMVPVLRGASLAVQAGEWVAILGASGSGKSTLLHLLGDLDRDDDDGRAVVHRGRTLAEFTPLECNRYRNETIGFVFQFYHLLPELDVLENTLLPGMVRGALRPGWQWTTAAAIGGAAGLLVGALGARLAGGSAASSPAAIATAAAAGGVAGAVAVPALLAELGGIRARLSAAQRARRSRAIELLDSFGLGHRLAHRPRELSGGERQRVAIARALLNQPAVLLADEPTGNLDQRTGEEILDLLAEQHRRGMAIVMVTHDPAIAARADRRVVLRDGVVVEA